MADDHVNGERDGFFTELSSGSNEMELESLCVSCYKSGVTRILTTHIPHCKDVIISSFHCEHCGYQNSDIQTAAVKELGIQIKLNVQGLEDLSRCVYRSDHAIITIPEVDLEIPPKEGEVTTVEGLIRRAAEEIGLQQDERRLQQPDIAESIDKFLDSLSQLLRGSVHFTFIIKDPSGNSCIESLIPTLSDPSLQQVTFARSSEENAMLGLYPTLQENVHNPLEDSKTESDTTNVELNTGEGKALYQTSNEKLLDAKSSSTVENSKSSDKGSSQEENNRLEIDKEMFSFSSICDRCAQPCSTNMKVTNIPHFKEVIIMACVCDNCGNRTNEVKTGGGISEMAQRITLKLCDPAIDMTRDVLKSETCNVEIPELELHVGGGIISGKFTTVEGILINIKEDLESNPFFMGDSAAPECKTKIKEVVGNIDKVIEGLLKSTLILDDPLANSYIQNIYAPDDDPNMTIEDYERSFEQNEQLGLNDMKTENYTS